MNPTILHEVLPRKARLILYIIVALLLLALTAYKTADGDLFEAALTLLGHEVGGHRLELLLGQPVTGQEDPERVAAGPVVADEHPQHVEERHAASVYRTGGAAASRTPSRPWRLTS